MNLIKELEHDIELETIAPKGRIGLILLATDFNAEQDLRRMLPDGIEIFTNRVLNANPLTLENLRTMAPDITRAAAGILPGVELDVMIYGCTSGTIANGAEEIERRVQLARQGIKVTNPATAVMNALAQLKVRRISILTPYIRQINEAMLEFYQKQGFEVLNIAGLGFDDDVDITGIPADAIYKAALEACHPEAEALFISCTSLRLATVIERLEASLERPVFGSNQALIWHALKLLGYQQPVKGFGCLLRLNGASISGR